MQKQKVPMYLFCETFKKQKETRLYARSFLSVLLGSGTYKASARFGPRICSSVVGEKSALPRRCHGALFGVGIKICIRNEELCLPERKPFVGVRFEGLYTDLSQGTSLVPYLFDHANTDLEICS
jgi:hypothetical protein